MSARPLLLDLFCGAGGAAMGYHRAGFDVLGVDVNPQPHYPFSFVRGDALDALRCAWRQRPVAVHASPPCQRFSTATMRNGTQLEHPDLIADVRAGLEDMGVPYVMENVTRAPLVDPELACGAAFSLIHDGFVLRRHRHLEANWPLVLPGCACFTVDLPVLDVTGGGPTRKPRTDGGGGRPYKGTADQARAIMRMPWATKAEVNEAVAPPITEMVGRQLYAWLGA